MPEEIALPCAVFVRDEAEKPIEIWRTDPVNPYVTGLSVTEALALIEDLAAAVRRRIAA